MNQTTLENYHNEPDKESVSFNSVETVLRTLKDWDITIEQCSKVLFSDCVYNIWITGRMEDFSEEIREFLISMFKVKFRGTDFNPQTLISFKIGGELTA